jgi:hypothetical protein
MRERKLLRSSPYSRLRFCLAEDIRTVITDYGEKHLTCQLGHTDWYTVYKDPRENFKSQAKA